MKTPTKNKLDKKKAAKDSTVKNLGGRPPEWVADDVATALFAWIEERYNTCKYTVTVAENGRSAPIMAGSIPYINAFCYEHRNPVNGRPLGRHIYELAINCPRLSEAIDACRCARSSKIDDGAMMGCLNSHYATAAQKQNDAGKFVEKQEVDLNAKIEGIDFTLNVIR